MAVGVSKNVYIRKNEFIEGAIYIDAYDKKYICVGKETIPCLIVDIKKEAGTIQRCNGAIDYIHGEIDYRCMDKYGELKHLKLKKQGIKEKGLEFKIINITKEECKNIYAFIKLTSKLEKKLNTIHSMEELMEEFLIGRYGTKWIQQPKMIKQIGKVY